MAYRSMFFRQLAALCLSLAFSTQLFAIEIYAHRGGAGLVPENTLAAIASALSIGVDVIDVDIGLTQDNIVVAHHDLNLNPKQSLEVRNQVSKALQFIRKENLDLYLDTETKLLLFFELLKE